MEELAKILREHAARYPVMEPSDAVKLIYQNEFGGGHLITDEEACLTFLRREYASVRKAADAIGQEPIGNGLVRVHLAALKEEDLSQLGRDFIRSAAAHRGNPERFRQKLEVLRKLTAEGIFRFSPKALDGYLADYQRAGCPAVSHSPAYREAYKPAYRIILK